MKVLFSFFALLFFLAVPAFAQKVSDVYLKAQVTSVTPGDFSDPSAPRAGSIRATLLEGKNTGKIVAADYTNPTDDLSRGDVVILDGKSDSSMMTYAIYERYRLNVLWWIAAGFLIFLIAVAGKRGIGALVGLIVSFGIILLYLIPQIISGAEPLQTTLTAAAFILIITTYVAHGISLKTTLAVISTAVSLLVAVGVAQGVVALLHVTGLGSEDIYNLTVGNPHPLNASGIFLGGLLIGTLGALNDITTTQVITIFTLIQENPQQKIKELFLKGMTIGREHIASLINTLVLAYAGTSLAVFIFFSLNPQGLPWWVILNNEATTEEIVRSIVGSTALILVVPISTWIAVWVGKKGTTIKELFT